MDPVDGGGAVEKKTDDTFSSVVTALFVMLMTLIFVYAFAEDRGKESVYKQERHWYESCSDANAALREQSYPTLDCDLYVGSRVTSRKSGYLA